MYKTNNIFCHYILFHVDALLCLIFILISFYNSIFSKVKDKMPLTIFSKIYKTRILVEYSEVLIDKDISLKNTFYSYSIQKMSLMHLRKKSLLVFFFIQHIYVFVPYSKNMIHSLYEMVIRNMYSLVSQFNLCIPIRLDGSRLVYFCIRYICHI